MNLLPYQDVMVRSSSMWNVLVGQRGSGMTTTLVQAAFRDTVDRMPRWNGAIFVKYYAMIQGIVDKISPEYCRSTEIGDYDSGNKTFRFRNGSTLHIGSTEGGFSFGYDVSGNYLGCVSQYLGSEFQYIAVDGFDHTMMDAVRMLQCRLRYPSHEVKSVLRMIIGVEESEYVNTMDERHDPLVNDEFASDEEVSKTRLLNQRQSFRRFVAGAGLVIRSSAWK